MNTTIDLHIDINKTILLSTSGREDLSSVVNQCVMSCLWGNVANGNFSLVEYKECDDNGDLVSYKSFVETTFPRKKRGIYASFHENEMSECYRDKILEFTEIGKKFIVVPSFLKCIKKLILEDNIDVRLFLRSYADTADFVTVVNEMNKFFSVNGLESMQIHSLTDYNVASFKWYADTPKLLIGSLDGSTVVDSRYGYDKISSWFSSTTHNRTYLIRDSYEHWSYYGHSCKSQYGKLLIRDSSRKQIFFDDNIMMPQEKGILNYRTTEGEYIPDHSSVSVHINLYELLRNDNYFYEKTQEKLNLNK